MSGRCHARCDAYAIKANPLRQSAYRRHCRRNLALQASVPVLEPYLTTLESRHLCHEKPDEIRSEFAFEIPLLRQQLPSRCSPQARTLPMTHSKSRLSIPPAGTDCTKGQLWLSAQRASRCCARCVAPQTSHRAKSGRRGARRRRGRELQQPMQRNHHPQGQFRFGSNGNLIDRKGFVEIDFHVPSDAPQARQRWCSVPRRRPWRIQAADRSQQPVDRVERSAEGSSLERYILSGNNLHLLRNSFNVHTPGGVGCCSRASARQTSVWCSTATRVTARMAVVSLT